MENVYLDIYHCTGCRMCENLCGQNAIKMERNSEGFLYPVINRDICSDCGACEKMCPQKNLLNYFDYRSNRAFALKHLDAEVLRQSTSGGAFTAIATTLASKHKDLVFYGAVLEKQGKEFYAIHRRVANVEDISCFRGSKYIQSDLSDVYNQIKIDLNAGRHVLFTGTPCQVAGIWQRFRRNPNFSNLYLVDIICHAVPSPLMFNEHIKNVRNQKGKDITDYKFRSKLTGWGHDEAAYLDNRPMFRNRLSQNHRDLFYKNIINRPSCDICQHATDNHVSDLTIADFWGIENILPDFDTSLGVSLVLVNTGKGIYIVDDINCAEIIEVNREFALKYNHHEPSKENSRRTEFWEDYYKYGYQYVLNKYDENTFCGRMSWYTKGIIRRILSDEMRANIKGLLGLK